MICSKCKKRIAVVFLTRMEGEKTSNEGYCFTCAKEMGIKPVDDIMQKMGISEEEMEAMTTEMEDLLAAEPDDENFEAGGAQTFPFLNNLFGNSLQPSQDNTKNDSKPNDTKKEDKKSKNKFLDSYCTNLTKKAKEGKIDRIIGRDKEIYRVIQILSRRTKNNPCLIGEPGVGKTAIAEGIAIKIAGQQVPSRIADKEIHLLDLTALVAGTQFRGQFESRVKGLIDEVKALGNIILFIDEVHNLVGTGDAEGSMNAANILKPALSRGEVQVIGATTYTEYRKYIEKDAALERRFQPVKVEEPSISDTIEVLLGVKEYYEIHHRVKISNALIKIAVNMSERYITDRFLPDKAIDLLDEACACASIKSKDLEDYERKMRKIKELQTKEEEMQANPDEVDYEVLAGIRAELIRLKDDALALEPAASSVEVTLEDLAKVIELWTGIPSSKVRESELSKVSGLEKTLKSKIIGQDEAVELVAAAIRRSRVQISPRRRPASFIFVGPTGVGKTELVKVLAKELFDSADPLIRLDMSEFMEKHAVSRIIGSPPGYVGYDEAGQLTEKVRRRPYSVVLFDEIEKAHPDVMNVLLQILDEGKITDSHGRTVNFENTIIVMTSNAGSELKGTGMGFNKTQGDIAKEKVLKSLSDFLRPEFLSRVDEVVVFSPLEKKDYVQIAELMLSEIIEPLFERGIGISWDQDALEKIAEMGFGGKHGARDLRRVIRKNVEDKIASILVDNSENPPKNLLLKLVDDALVVDYK